MPDIREMLLTAVILTKNEEHNLRRCLTSIPAGIKIVIVDSGSTDKTVVMAEEHGAKVHHNAWEGFAAQRNFAIQNCGIDTNWILFIDADEVYEPDFYHWARTTLAENPPVDVYDVPSTLFIYGRPLKYAPGYPVLHPRLVRRESTVFVPNFSGHGEMTEPCRRALAPFGYVHHFFQGISPWLIKHIGLAQKEAFATTAKAATVRSRLSRLVPRTWIRPFLRFFYHYVFRRGFLDGRRGFYYSMMYTWYEFTMWLIHEEGKLRD